LQWCELVPLAIRRGKLLAVQCYWVVHQTAGLRWFTIYHTCGGAFRVVRNVVVDFLTLLFNATFQSNLDRERIRKPSPSTDR